MTLRTWIDEQVCRLMPERSDKGFYTVSRSAPAAAPPGPVVLMTWGRPEDEPRPRRLYMAAHSDPPAPEPKPRRLGCCQIAAAVIALLAFYVLLLMGILYATGSVDALVAGSEGRQRVDAACAGVRPYLAAFVHSAPTHGLHRAVVRRTWGSVRDVDGAAVRVVFVVGRATGAGAEALQADLDAEARRHGDLVQADFVDTYRNLTVKHLVSLRWMLTHCGQARFIVKADDDAYLDVFQLVRFMRRTHGDAAPGALVCNVLPAGTPVQRAGKWAVTPDEFAAAGYPRFCGGLLYLAGPETVARLYRAARRDPHPLWVDDAFVTGLAAERAGVEHFYMNLRYTYDLDELRHWAASRQPRPLPYMVGHMDAEAGGWAALADRLWQKTLLTSQSA
ncbi:beta-1,3-galactosyltransferase 5-like [Pollicipes pollicipes]|uniref:beta-1,3-galactosyltransferase 5-like n=1 Tax=Pollicipes pollicipes TaxID=41117 RepID=UPI001884B1F5|nr:beta-1,3-galactosyltransferase 5-like [Pollicipes pollicipes]